MPTGARVLAVLVSSLALLGGGGAAFAAGPIGPGQHFLGIVNGATPNPSDVPVVYTVCAGPVSTSRTGPIAGGQTLAVVRTAGGGGYTGPFSHVYAWFVEDSSPRGPQQVTFVTYGTKAAVPAEVRVPCDGTGQVNFSPCPHLAPCAAGWRPLLVKVRFENIAY